MKRPILFLLCILICQNNIFAQGEPSGEDSHYLFSVSGGVVTTLGYGGRWNPGDGGKSQAGWGVQVRGTRFGRAFGGGILCAYSAYGNGFDYVADDAQRHASEDLSLLYVAPQCAYRTTETMFGGLSASHSIGVGYALCRSKTATGTDAETESLSGVGVNYLVTLDYGISSRFSLGLEAGVTGCFMKSRDSALDIPRKDRTSLWQLGVMLGVRYSL